MGQPNVNNLDSPVGPLRDRYVMSVGTEDIEFPRGAIVQVAAPLAAGVLEYQTLVGSADQSEVLAAGSFPNVCGVPVVIKTILGASTVTSVIVGAL